MLILTIYVKYHHHTKHTQTYTHIHTKTLQIMYYNHADKASKTVKEVLVFLRHVT